MDEPSSEVAAIIRKYALQNALEYDGAGQTSSVMGRVMGENPDLRSQAAVLTPHIARSVEEANAIARESGLDHLRELLATEAPEALEKRQKERRTGLPPLPNAESGGVVLRFAPNPNGPLSLGHARGVTINSEFAKMHDGQVILRFDDTDTRVKPPDPAAYSMIEADFEWLTGRPADRIIRASERMPVYLEHAETMLETAAGYVCTCTAKAFSGLRKQGVECPCRQRAVERNLELWGEMKDGTTAPGGAVVRVRTSMSLANPALRDWPALRIQHEPHPIVGDAYRVWPLLDFQSAVEDHLQGVTHIVRGKDLMDSTRKQTLLYEKFGWDYPETLYWGRVKIHELGAFSTSEMRAAIEAGRRTGWDDPRLPTLLALRRRGFSGAAIRAFWLELGLTQKDISVPMATLEALNCSEVDSDAPRLTFVRDPVSVTFDATGLPDLPAVTPAVHPDHADRGTRGWPILTGPEIEVLLEDDDIETARRTGRIRLKDFADASISSAADATLISAERLGRTPIVHWLPVGFGQPVSMLSTNGDLLEMIEGVLESHDHVAGTVVQLERVGYARLESTEDGGMQLIHLHG